MNKAQGWTIVGCIVALTVGCLWGGTGLTRVLYAAVEKWGSSDPASTLLLANGTLEFVNRPCASVDKNGHLLPDGPICELDEAIHDIRKITTASGEQVKQTGKLLDASTTAIATVATAATGTLNQGTETLKIVNDPDKGLPATLAKVNGGIDDFQGWMKSKAVRGAVDNIIAATGNTNRLMGNSADTMANLTGITADGKKVADKTSADYLKARTPWGKVGTVLMDTYDIIALGARHTP